MNLTQAKSKFAALMKKARTKTLTAADRAMLKACRSHWMKRSKVKIKTNRGKRSMTPVNKSKAIKRITGKSVIRRMPKARLNPRQGDRIGRIVEIRYYRDIGKHRGYYKHVFEKNASVYCLADKTILIAE